MSNIDQRGSKNPAWVGGPKYYSKGSISRTCEHCDSEFETFPSRIKKGLAKYCSAQCRINAMNKRKAVDLVCARCGKQYNTPKSRAIAKVNYCSRECWIKRSVWIEFKCEQCNKAFVLAPKTAQARNARYCSKKCMGLAWRGEDSPSWKGGYYDSEHLKLRASPEYKEWRKDVFERDKYKCRKCGDDKGGNLHAHHIYSIARFVEYGLEGSNGLTFCNSCHDKFHKIYGTHNFQPEDTYAFLGGQQRLVFGIESVGDSERGIT